MKRFLIILVVLVAVVLASLAAAIAIGGPGQPSRMSSISDPFKKVDFSDLPELSHFTARDGTKLAFRAYPAATDLINGSVVLVHGSSATSSSMHLMAKGFAGAGYTAYALDIRGHGGSGIKGHIGYIGQLEDDLEDFARSTKLAQPSSLIGFSSGGGFVLRFAGSARQKLFANYLLLSPYISPDAATSRPSSGGWVSVGVPRIIAISILHGFGLQALDNLPVIRFAVTEENNGFLTPQYSFALAQNFQPERDYQASIRAMSQPVRIVVGQNDQLFYADKFASVFQTAGKDVPVTILPGLDHISLTLDPGAIQAAVAAVASMDHEGPNQAMEQTPTAFGAAGLAFRWTCLQQEACIRARGT